MMRGSRGPEEALCVRGSEGREEGPPRGWPLEWARGREICGFILCARDVGTAEESVEVERRENEKKMGLFG